MAKGSALATRNSIIHDKGRGHSNSDTDHGPILLLLFHSFSHSRETWRRTKKNSDTVCPFMVSRGKMFCPLEHDTIDDKHEQQTFHHHHRHHHHHHTRMHVASHSRLVLTYLSRKEVKKETWQLPSGSPHYIPSYTAQGLTSLKLN